MQILFGFTQVIKHWTAVLGGLGYGYVDVFAFEGSHSHINSVLQGRNASCTSGLKMEQMCFLLDAGHK